MKRFRLVLCALALAAIGMAGQAAVGDVIVNGGFEDPVYEGDQLVPASTGWNLGTEVNIGVMPAGAVSAWGITDVADNPELFGAQCMAFYTDTDFWQTFEAAAGDGVTFSFYAQDLADASGSVYTATLTVLLDDVPLTFGGVGSLFLDNETMTQYTTDPVSLSEGTHTLKFQTDFWAFIDNVGSTAMAPEVPVADVPEPSTLATLWVGMIGLLVCAWRKRR